MSKDDYQEFVASKLLTAPPTGISHDVAIHPSLKKFQAALCRFSLRRGRSALFANTGLGKTRTQGEWARHVHNETKRDVLILAPLSVAPQTAEECRVLGLDITVCRDGSDVKPGVNITNYDRLHRFDPERFVGVVCDESSIIKHSDAKTFQALTEAFRGAIFKLCCTATPAPNDWTELGTHAEFLGICTKAEMLSEYFVHDGGETQKWRIKGHARGAFWKWVSSWGALVSHPRDLGPEYDDKGYDLPPYELIEHILPMEAGTAQKAGVMFVEEAAGLMAQRAARRLTIDQRTGACHLAIMDSMANLAREIGGAKLPPALIWCDLNDEQDALERLFGDLAFSVRGADTSDEKEAAVAGWLAGERPVMISKPKIMGWGLCFHFCSIMAFVGVTHSWESYYQSVRRCWRFGQTRKVQVHIFASEAEGAVVKSLTAKEDAANEMSKALAMETCEALREAVHGARRESNPYEPTARMTVPKWLRTVEE